MQPTRANCAVNGIHLGDSRSDVLRKAGKPTTRQNYYPKAREEVTVWTWGVEAPPRLYVTFDKNRVCGVVGTALTVGTDYKVIAGAPLSETRFLGRPEGEDLLVGSLNAWLFPEVSLAIFSLAPDLVTGVQIENPKPQN